MTLGPKRLGEAGRSIVEREGLFIVETPARGIELWERHEHGNRRVARLRALPTLDEVDRLRGGDVIDVRVMEAPYGAFLFCDRCGWLGPVRRSEARAERDRWRHPHWWCRFVYRKQ